MVQANVARGLGLRTVSAVVSLTLVLTGTAVLLETAATPAAAEAAPLVCADPEPTGSPNLTEGNDSQSKCVVGAERTVRGYLRNCPTEPRAVVVGSEYAVGECKGKVTFQVEAVAQARMVARLNAAAGGPATEIGPGVQWEVRLPGLLASKRIDILRYDPTSATSDVALVELKRGAPGSTAEDDAAEQVEDYVDNLPDVGAHPVAPMSFAQPYTDSFVITQQCGGTAKEVEFEVHSTVPGVVMVYPSDTPEGGQRLRDGEERLSCPVLVDPTEVPDEPQIPITSDSPSGGQLPACEYDLQAVQDWMDDAVDYLLSAELVIAEFARSHGRSIGKLIDKMTDQEELIESAPTPADDCPPPPPGGVLGDPHLTTLDGMAYDVQSVGEFELLNAPDLGLQVQARFAPLWGSSSVSVYDRIAMTLNGFRVEMDSSDHLWVDGHAVSLPEGRLLYFNGGIFMEHSDARYRIVIPGAAGAGYGLVTWSKNRFAVRLASTVETSGLLGNHDGNPNNDVVTKSGEPVPDNLPVDRFIHGQFARSWAITNATSLFTYPAGTDTSTYTDTDYPVGGSPRIEDYPAEEVEDATTSCAEVAAGSAQDGCVLDVLVTGGTEFLDDALGSQSAVVQNDAELGDPPTLDVDFDSTVPRNFLPSKFGWDTELGKFVGPLKSGGNYAFTVPVTADHDGVQVAFDVLAVGPMTEARQRSLAITVGETTDRVYLTKQGAEATSGDVVEAEQGLVADGRTFTRYRYTGAFPAVGGSLQADLSVSGFSRLQNDSLGIDNIELSLVGAATPTATTVSIGDTVKPDDNGRATIASRGERDVYTFTVSEEQAGPVQIEEIYGPGLQYECADHWRLTSVTTGRTLTGSPCLYDRELSAGTYRLEVIAGPGATYPYRYAFHLHGDLALQTFSTDVGDEPVTFEPQDDTGAGVIDGSGGNDRYALNVTEAGRLVVDIECLDSDDPDCVQASFGRLGGSSSWLRRGAADVTPGTYYLELLTLRGGPHHYRVTLHVAEDAVHQLSFGDVVKPGAGSDLGVADRSDPVDRYQFDVPTGGASVVVGQLPGFDVWAPGSYWYGSMQKVCKYWTLTGPQGQTYDACGANWSTTANQLSAGRYTLEVWAPPSLGSPYQYGFELYRVHPSQTQEFNLTWTDGTYEVVPDTATGEGVLSSLGATDVYFATAPSNGRLSATVTCTDDPCPVVEVARMEDGYPWALDARWADVTAGTPLRISVSGGVGGAHEYDLDLAVTPWTEYELGDTVEDGTHGAGSGEWNSYSEVDTYQFTVPAGGMDIGLQTEGVANGRFKILDEAGQDVYLFSWYSPYQTSHIDAGTYRIQVGNNWDEDHAEYKFRVFEVNLPPTEALTLGTATTPAPVTGSLSSNADRHEYTFEVETAGEYTLELDGDVEVSWNEIPENASIGDIYAPRFWLDEGTYRLAVMPTYGAGFAFGSFDYELSLRDATPLDTFDYTLGDLVDSGVGDGIGTLQDWSDTDAITFEVPAGGQDLAFIVSGLDDPCSQLTLMDSGWNLVGINCDPLGWGQFIDAGTYTLYVNQGWVDHGDVEYTLRIVAPAVSAPTAIHPQPEHTGTTEVVSGTVPSNGAVASYTFTLSEYQTSVTPYLQVEPGEDCAQIRVFHEGDLIGTGGCNLLPMWAEPGQYRLEVTGRSGDPFRYLVYTTDQPEWS